MYTSYIAQSTKAFPVKTPMIVWVNHSFSPNCDQIKSGVGNPTSGCFQADIELLLGSNPHSESYILCVKVDSIAVSVFVFIFVELDN